MECSDPTNTGTHRTDTATFLETKMHDVKSEICVAFVWKMCVCCYCLNWTGILLNILIKIPSISLHHSRRGEVLLTGRNDDAKSFYLKSVCLQHITAVCMCLQHICVSATYLCVCNISVCLQHICVSATCRCCLYVSATYLCVCNISLLFVCVCNISVCLQHILGFSTWSCLYVSAKYRCCFHSELHEPVYKLSLLFPTSYDRSVTEYRKLMSCLLFTLVNMYRVAQKSLYVYKNHYMCTKIIICVHKSLYVYINHQFHQHVKAMWHVIRYMACT
jgi:hypothetical protein